MVMLRMHVVIAQSDEHDVIEHLQLLDNEAIFSRLANPSQPF